MNALALVPVWLTMLLTASGLSIVDEPERFAPGIASTSHSEVRLTISPDGHTALWFSRNRPGGPGGYDIWMSRRTGDGWGAAEPVPFNSPGRDFDRPIRPMAAMSISPRTARTGWAATTFIALR